ncbi:acyl-CoA dehydratase activase-related protein [Anaeroselena agilis]|uniref:Acyl-CoA dehydratase activase-related protein n=1 Tax=Anaeroselena agilis TaxID=3063788 RepID=A0ABU3NUU0_9FIRM|nr:acyl-CoA dehydratase activase-related protein [Selenomonadales bacterium 4137-cl]
MTISVGIPRALLFHEFGELWQSFFSNLGVAVSVSPATTKTLLDRGTSLAVDESCLPLKLYLGHAESLLGCSSHLFVPRIACYHRDYYLCAKFAGLPDIVRNTFGLSADRVIAPDVDGRRPLCGINAVRTAAGAVGRSTFAGLASLRQALAAWRTQPAGPGVAADTKVAVIGHSYILRDPFLGGEVLSLLAARSVATVTPDDVPARALYAEAGRFAPEVHWQLSAKLAGATRYFAVRPDIAGLVLVSCFGCGPDSLVNEFLEYRVLKGCGKPYLILNVDEHTGRAGVATRVEAFWDLVEWRRRK